MDQESIDEIRVRFKIICRNCESDQVAMSGTAGVDYGGQTGFAPGHVAIGCNACKQNDLYVFDA